VSNSADYTPPLGISALTPVYDQAVALLTRERHWRARLVEELAPRPGDRILDVGSGTGSMALAATQAEPRCIYRGIDPDAAAVNRARQEAAQTESNAQFEVGFLSSAPPSTGDRVDKIVCSLVLHQVPVAEKRRLLRAIHDWLKPGGQLLIADYGEQKTWTMRLAFRFTVQLLDGRRDTQPNADGLLPSLITEAGFQSPSVRGAFDTPTGRIEIIRARVPMVETKACCRPANGTRRSRAS